jgi:hypothetical protein
MVLSGRIVFCVGLAEKFFLITAAVLGLLPLLELPSSHHAGPDNYIWILGIPGIYFALFAVYYAFSFRLIFDDGFIIRQAIGKFQAMRFDDIESWRVQTFAFGMFGRYIVRSRSGITLDFTRGVDRPLELKRILESATPTDEASAEPSVG